MPSLLHVTQGLTKSLLNGRLSLSQMNLMTMPPKRQVNTIGQKDLYIIKAILKYGFILGRR